MKRCPTCQRTFPDESPDYCLHDGQRLVKEEAAVFGPEKASTASGVRLDEATKKESPFEAGVQPPAAPPFQAQSPTPPAPQALPPQPSTPWEGQYRHPAQVPFGPPGVLAAARGKQILSTGALVLGVDVATLMLVKIVRSDNFAQVLMLVLSGLCIFFAVAALFLIIKHPARFGGVEMAIVGLSLGVAGLVYFLLNQS